MAEVGGDDAGAADGGVAGDADRIGMLSRLRRCELEPLRYNIFLPVRLRAGN